MSLLVAVIPRARQATGQSLEATPPTSNWNALPAGSTFEPITEGTVDELLLISEFVAISRVTAQPMEPGVWSFYNDNPGMIGPRILYVEQGVMMLGPINTSPGSGTGPTLLVRPTAPPAVVLPGSTIEVHPDEMIFFPADTAFDASNFEGKVIATFLQIDVFPTYPPGSGIMVEGMVAERLAVNLGIETADPPAPPMVDVGRLALEPQAIISAPKALAGPQLFYVEQGYLTVIGHDGKIQLKRNDTANPGEIVEPEIGLALAAGDAFMISPGGSSTLQIGDAPTTLLVIEVGHSNWRSVSLRTKNELMEPTYERRTTW